MDIAPGQQVCSCGDLIQGEPDGKDERGMPLCWICTLERQMAAEPDWPPSPGSAFKGCLIGMVLAGGFWCGVGAVVMAVLAR